MTVIAARIVNTEPIYVTFLVTPRLLERVQTELSRNFPPEDRAYLDLIR